MQDSAVMVRKRDGRVEPYDRNKLSVSVTAAAIAATSEKSRDSDAREDILTVLGISPIGGDESREAVHEAYARSTIGDELYESVELVVELVENFLEDEYGDGEPVSTGDLSIIVHRALVEAEQGELLREYIMRASSRERAIEGAGALMRAVSELTFTNSQNSNAKRDNANVDGETAMGTMLQYGSTASKTFALHSLIPKHIAEAHSAGGIHIHDLEFYPLTLTCISADQRIVVRHSGRVKVWRAARLSAYVSGEPVDFEVWSRGGFIKVNKVMSKPAREGAEILSVTTVGGAEFRVTPEHFVTVFDEAGETSDIVAMELVQGMKLVRDGCTGATPITSISLNPWFRRASSIYLDDKDGKVAEVLNGDGSWSRSMRRVLSKSRISGMLSGRSRLKATEFNEGCSEIPTESLYYTTRDGQYSMSDTLPLTRDLAYFMGAMLVSGAYCSGGLFYAAPDEAVKARFIAAAESVFWKDCVVADGLKCKLLGEERLLQALFDGPLGSLRSADLTNRYAAPCWLSEAPLDFVKAFVEGMTTNRLLPKRIDGMYETVSLLSTLGINVGIVDSRVVLDVEDYDIVDSVATLPYTGALFDLETENHHFAVNGFTVHNCCQIDLDKLFEGGFNTGHGYIRTPASIESYAALTCIAIQSNQNDMHGGQSTPSLDYYLEIGVAKTIAAELAEFVRAEYEISERGTVEEHEAIAKNIKKDLFDYIQEHRVLHTDDGKAYAREVVGKYAPDCIGAFEKTWSVVDRRVIKRTGQAMESLVHNLNSMHSRAGAQIPFSSLNFGTCVTWEGRLVSHKFLDAVEAGLGAGETPIFPISIFKMKKGVNVYSTDPNYDLFKKAIHVTSRRMYPNFCSIDAPFNLQYYEEGNFASEVAYMGCLAGFERVAYRYKGEVYMDSFERVWDRLLADGVKVVSGGLASYMEPTDLWAYDSRSYGLTRVKTLIRNTHVTEWLEVCTVTGRRVFCTPDHPWPTDSGRKAAEDLVAGDKLFLTLSGETLKIPPLVVGDLYKLGVEYAKGSTVDTEYSYLLYETPEKRSMFVRGMLSSADDAGDSYMRIDFNTYDRALTALNVFSVSGYDAEFVSNTVLRIDPLQRREVVDNGIVEDGKFNSVTVAWTKRRDINDQFSYDFETETGWFDVSGLQSFNCRTRVIADVNGKDEVTGRGNLSFTTLNLPQIALRTKTEDAFFKELEHRLEIVLEQLLSRMGIQSKRKVANMPFLMGQCLWKNSETLNNEDDVGPVLKHGTLSIGFAGLAEALTALTGKHHGESEEAQALGLRIIKFMRDFCDNKSTDLSLNVTLLATPAESTCGRFLQIDRREFGRIPGVTEHEYYTNSFHVPVWYKTSTRHKVEVEAPYHPLTNAGHITYVELDGDAGSNEQAVEDLVMLMYNNNCGYFGVSHAIDFDPVCGYTGFIGDGPCPRCGRKEFEDVPFERL